MGARLLLAYDGHDIRRGHTMASDKDEPKPNSGIAVIYCRVSSEGQAKENKTSLDDQEQRGRATAAQLGVRILYVARHAESAWVLDKRSQFQGILADARVGKFGVLIVDRMNRFSRSEDLSDPILVLRTLQDSGVQVKFSDKQYTDDISGQLTRLIDLYLAGKDQQDRRKATYDGKVGRVTKGKHPLPGRRASYGFIWVPTKEGETKKTELMRDPGSAQAIVRKIWDYFLHYQPTPRHPRPSIHGLQRLLSNEGVPPPRVYQGIRNDKGAMRPTGWCRHTLTVILKDPRYWGEPVEAFRFSKHSDTRPTVAIPSYVRAGEAYVTLQEAKRVHAMLGWNGQHSGRPTKRNWGTLLHAGLAVCGYCRKRLDPYDPYKPRPDGTMRVYYRCSTSQHHGWDPQAGGCTGVSINAAVLDCATLDCLNHNLSSVDFLDSVFSAWGRNEGAAADAVQVAKAALEDVQEQIGNLALWAARTPPDSPAGATLQHQLDQLNEVLPGLGRRYEDAQLALSKVRANTALADELREWFSAWFDGFASLSIERQRMFLTALHAKVTVWREDEPTRAGLPRAELVIGLPTDRMQLPPPPSLDLASMEVKAAPDGWHVPLDLQGGKQLAEIQRAIDSGELLAPESAAELDEQRRAWEALDAGEVMARGVAEMRERGYSPPPGYRPRKEDRSS